MNRRALLTGLAVAPLRVAPAVATATATASHRHRVTRLEVFRLPVNRRGDWILLRLHTDSGLVGHGDASHGGDDGQTAQYLKRFADLLRGESIFAIERFRAATGPIAMRETAASAVAAASALEQCLWDLAGRALGVPTHVLFGGKLRETVELYANINRSTDPRTPDGFAAMARRAVAAGFGAVKLAPFDAMPADLDRSRPVDTLIEQGIACARAVRDAIGPQRKLMIDAHSRFTEAEGLELVRRLAPLDLFWLEEVTPAKPTAPLVAIDRAAPMPTAGGEAVRYASGFYDYLRERPVDIAMPDVKICGGMAELKVIAAIARAAGVRLSPHGPPSPVGSLAAAHVAATLPGFEILEHAFGEVPWRAGLIEPGESIERGHLRLSDEPGFGIRLNDRLLHRRAVTL